ncbi:DUF4177 domain-containing protein [Cypionkella sp.]|jgi:hypothetical protein|uniref:DUF4177 domain-containing protein n=1 Tax=Cypionkella sp. TaxID=2811411 RepID=UPI00276E9F7D|nr:DUF4177 domain-containing protein [Cypionkella sp.]
MPQYEFKVVPAPRRGEKARGVKTTEDRFALALTTLMNDLGRDGWDYLRADSFPVDERAGFTGTKTTQHLLLVFRRVIEAAAPAAPAPVAPAAPAPARASLMADAVTPALTRKLGAAEPADTGTAPAVGGVKPE